MNWGEVYTLLGFPSSHHSCPKCRCLSSGSCPAFLWGCREDLVLQWFPSGGTGGTGGTTSWAWENNSSAWMGKHSRHPQTSEAELADVGPPGGQCLPWESSGAQTGQSKMLDDLFLDFWALGCLSFCCYELIHVARNAVTHLSMDCSPENMYRNCLFSCLAAFHKLSGTVLITNMGYSPGFSNTSSEEYQTFAQLFVDEVSAGEGCDLLPVSIKPCVWCFSITACVAHVCALTHLEGLASPDCLRLQDKCAG